MTRRLATKLPQICRRLHSEPAVTHLGLGIRLAWWQGVQCLSLLFRAVKTSIDSLAGCA